MPNNAMYVRCVAVIKSCRHSHHLRTARKYIDLARDSMAVSHIDYRNLLACYIRHRSEIFGGSAG